jgi:hypothetical protein
VVVVPGFELRALRLYLLGRYFTTRATPLALFALVILEIRVSLFAQASLDHAPSLSGFLP